MSNGYPYRVTIWRRTLEEKRELVRRLTRAAPAILGVLLLLVSIPGIGRVLSTEIELTSGEHGLIQVSTDCPGLALAAYVYPEYREGEELPGDFLVSEMSLVELIVSGSYLDPGCGTAELTLLHPDSAGPKGSPEIVTSQGDVSMTEDGRIRVELAAIPMDPRDGLPSDPTESLPSDPRVAPQAPSRTTLPPSRQAAFGSDPGAPLPSDPRSPREPEAPDDSELAVPEASLMVKWPNLYRYSHRGHGWINRWLDSSSAGIEFTVVWQGDSDPFDIPPLDVDLLIFAPYDYDVSYTQDVNLRERAQNRVSYRNHIDAEGKQGFNALHAKTRFRTSSHEAKLNYVLLAGGAAVGLGITLIVESLISALVRLERSLRKKTKRRRGLGAVDSSASDQEAGDEAE